MVFGEIENKMLEKMRNERKEGGLIRRKEMIKENMGEERGKVIGNEKKMNKVWKSEIDEKVKKGNIRKG